MLIEVFGGNFANKGAELMLRTCVDRINRELPDTDVCIESRTDSSFRERAELGLLSLFPTPEVYPASVARVIRRFPIAAGVSRAIGTAILPKAAPVLYGAVPMGGADALLDIQGYAYGDKFHHAKPGASAQRAGWYKKRRKPVVLLPQMLGPFTNPKVADNTKRLAANADRIYARDARSFELMTDLIGPTDVLKRAPDITIFAPASQSTPPGLPDGPFACVVPNARMLDKGGPEWASVYMDRMRAAIKRLHERGLHPLLVVHERAGKDEQMARELLDDCNVGSLYSQDSSQILKAAIARSTLLVGSRFHSVVAALSTGVPAIVLGWAHKYPALLDDFGVPDLIHDASDPESHLVEFIDRFADERERNTVQTTLAASKSKMQEQNDAMWNDVFDLIRRANQG